jgi:hypothetical protein
MSFLDWMNMNMAVDIACVVFFAAVTWKLRRQQSELAEIRKELTLVIKNPAAAKRRLKQKQ